MDFIKNSLKKYREEISKKRPLVHCITNVVTVNDCANIILAVGGLATMAHHKMEVYEITSRSNALVCNMGATEYIEEMFISCEAAKDNNIPIIIDPVGASASSFRREKCRELIEKYTPTCIKGNVAEILSLFYDKSMARGVDIEKNTDEELVELENITKTAKELANKHKTIIVVSGENDIVTDGNKVFWVKGGSKMMTRITGAGCMLAAVIGVYLGNEPSFDGVVCACKNMKEAAEMAESILIEGDGSATFKMNLIDKIYNKEY